MEINIQTRAKIINKFLKDMHLKPTDLARYLELHHDFCCYADTQYDDSIY